ncbi:MAG: electron transfer flavoprotein subunit beta/FixA family protein [Desulfobacterales bacterium]|nr:electron transfer flavoprotein subunit beta/FixA family protein [Desulfobacterales bacterium]
MLNIVVCVKAVPDPKEAHNIKIDPKTKMLSRRDVPLVINPLDKNALEAALLIKKKDGAHISVLSMGPPKAENIIKECLALGADKGYLLSDPAFGGADAYATAHTLAKGVQKIGAFDLILCGMASADGATEWVGPEMATFLDVPVVTMVDEFRGVDGEWWTVKARIENGRRLVKVGLPALFTVTRELNTPRTLSFSGIIKARKKEATVWGIGDLGVPENTVGLKGSPTIVSRLSNRETGRQVEMIDGSREEKAERLARILADAGVL